jgi:hypothetical protein
MPCGVPVTALVAAGPGATLGLPLTEPRPGTFGLPGVAGPKLGPLTRRCSRIRPPLSAWGSGARYLGKVPRRGM